MKYAIFSDVHGNAPALRLALDDARQHGAEGFLFAGDYCISLPWAGEVIALIRSLENAHIIRGNDEAHLDVPPGRRRPVRGQPLVHVDPDCRGEGLAGRAARNP